MEKVKIKTEYIKLDQFLKWTGMAGSGVGAKETIGRGIVKVNGETVMQRGKKLRVGDKIELGNKMFEIT
ncbi:MAG: RNA-binding S4 domain-containing protein [Clostridiales bacterium]|jgi:ribosome-associated protein|nr:RNA-binding S4 domain-containing protein [Eubacteriales bacterium]MDH7567060.1 RNA-binding S4 domain-containing protein [Clostridiales bacterium]